jgi:hypothetical protein
MDAATRAAWSTCQARDETAEINAMETLYPPRAARYRAQATL